MEPVPKPEFAIVTRASSKAWIPEVIAYAGAEVTETYLDEYTVEVLYAACFCGCGTIRLDMEAVLMIFP
jgi:hypothetical protein